MLFVDYFTIINKKLESLLFALFVIFLLIQFFYYVTFFLCFSSHKEDLFISGPLPKVSVVVATHNDIIPLKSLLKNLKEQDYPCFEVIVIDDRSTDGTKDFIEKEYKDFVRILRIEEENKNTSNKKNALNYGIKAASHEIVLLTDADCLPLSNQWIKQMVQGFGKGKEIVIGYSKYEKRKGFLNKLIQFETFFTGMQYISHAILGKPYMGVGRNLAYNKELFFRNRGFETHEQIIGGDDDLLIQEVANGKNVSLRINELSQTISIPKTTYIEWFKQKRRHLTAGTYYKFLDKFSLGLFMLSNVFFYFILFFFVFIDKHTLFMIIVFILRTLGLILILNTVIRKLKEKFKWYWIPIVDLAYLINYILIGLSVVLRKSNKWM